MPDGRRPEPGGWNRIQLQVEDLASEVETLRNAGAHFRNDIVTGQGGKQILLDDPAGNPIELLEPPRKQRQDRQESSFREGTRAQHDHPDAGRGAYCPKARQQLAQLVEFSSRCGVGDTRIATFMCDEALRSAMAPLLCRWAAVYVRRSPRRPRAVRTEPRRPQRESSGRASREGGFPMVGT